MKKYQKLYKSMVTAGVISLSALSFSNYTYAMDELNALVWCDHTDPALIKPFEEKYNVKVNLKEYEGTGAGISILEQSREGDWDVFVVDGVDVSRVAELGLLAPMEKDKLPIGDLFPQVKMEHNTVIDGKTYAIIEKFGYNTISYNNSAVDAEDMKDLSKVWSEKYKGRVAIYDYYLPLVGITGLANGIKTSDLNSSHIDGLRKELFKMKDASKLVGGVVSSQTALATGEVDILIGGGEWLTAALSADNPDLKWVIPKQGGLLWAQSIGVVQGSKKPDLAMKFIQYIASPEGQARLATSSCYWGMPANKKAGAHLSSDEKKALRWDDQEEYLSRAQFYPIPNADLDVELQDLWTEMLQH